MSDDTTIPNDFWGQIDHQLQRIVAERATTFDAVREILLDEQYDAITEQGQLYRQTQFDKDSAFFSGSGGRSLEDALVGAGWKRTAVKAYYHYVTTNAHTGETLTYTEGDVQRGDLLTTKAPAYQMDDDVYDQLLAGAGYPPAPDRSPAQPPTTSPEALLSP